MSTITSLPRPPRDDLRARLLAITAAGAVRRLIRDSLGRLWDSDRHPRDRNGRFIETLGDVKVFDSQSASKPHYNGRVLAMNPDGTATVQITGANPNERNLIGSTTNVPFKNLEGVEYKARLGAHPLAALDQQDHADIQEFVARIRAARPDGADQLDPPTPQDDPATQLGKLEALAEHAEDANLPDVRDDLLAMKAQVRQDPSDEEQQNQIKGILGTSPEAAPPTPPEAVPHAASPDAPPHQDFAALSKGLTPQESNALEDFLTDGTMDPRVWTTLRDKVAANVRSADMRSRSKPAGSPEQATFKRMNDVLGDLEIFGEENRSKIDRATPKATTTSRGTRATRATPNPPIPGSAKTADDAYKADLTPDEQALYDAIKSGATPTPAQAATYRSLTDKMFETRESARREADLQGARSPAARRFKDMRKITSDVHNWGDDRKNKDLIEQGKATPAEPTPEVKAEVPAEPTPEPAPEPEPEPTPEPEPAPAPVAKAPATKAPKLTPTEEFDKAFRDTLPPDQQAIYDAAVSGTPPGPDVDQEAFDAVWLKARAFRSRARSLGSGKRPDNKQRQSARRQVDGGYYRLSDLARYDQDHMRPRREAAYQKEREQRKAEAALLPQPEVPPPPTIEQQIQEATDQLDALNKQNPRSPANVEMKRRLVEHWQGVLAELKGQQAQQGGEPSVEPNPEPEPSAPGGDAGAGGVGRELPTPGAEGSPGVGAPPDNEPLAQPGPDDHDGISDSPNDLDLEGAENAATEVDSTPAGNDPYDDAVSQPEPGLTPAEPAEPAEPTPAPTPSSVGGDAPPGAPTPDPNHPGLGLPEQDPEERRTAWQQFGDVFRNFFTDFKRAINRLFGRDQQSVTVKSDTLAEELSPENFEAKFPPRPPDLNAPDPTRRRAVVLEPHDNGTTTITTGEAKLTPGRGVRPPAGSAAQTLSAALSDMVDNGDVNDARGGSGAAADLSRALHDGDWPQVSDAFARLRKSDALPAPVLDSIQRELSDLLNNPNKAHLSPAAPTQDFPGWEKVDLDDWNNRDWAAVAQANVRGLTSRMTPAWAAQVISYMGADGRGTQPRKVYRKGDFTVAVTEDFEPHLVQAALDRLEHLQAIDPNPGPKTVFLTDLSKVKHGGGQNVFGDAFTNSGLMRINLRLLNEAETGRVVRDVNWSKPSRDSPDVSEINYTITHEWGHTRGPTWNGYDNNSPELTGLRDAVFKDLGIRGVSDGKAKGLLNGYESTNAAEFYAENYAEYVNTNGQTKNRVAQAFAKRAGLSTDGAGNVTFPPVADPGDGPRAWTSGDTSLRKLASVTTPEGASQALEWLRTTFPFDTNLMRVVDALSDPEAFEPDPTVRWMKISAMINTTARALDGPNVISGLTNLAQLLDSGFADNLAQHQAQTSMMKRLRRAIPDLDIQGMPTDSTAFQNLAGSMLMRRLGFDSLTGTFATAFPEYRNDPKYHDFLKQAFDLVAGMRKNARFDDNALAGFGPEDSDRSKYAATAEHYADMINTAFPTPGDAWRNYFANLHAKAFPDDTFDPNVPGINGRGEIDEAKAKNNLPDPDIDPNGKGVTTKPQGAPTAYDPNAEAEAVAKGARASIISLAKEYFRGREERAKRGVGNVKLSERYAFDGKGRVLQKNDLIWLGIRDNRGRPAAGDKKRPSGDGYIVNIEVVAPIDKVTGQRRPEYDKDGHPLVRRIIVRHYDPDYIGSEHPRKDKREEGVIWRLPYWDYEVKGSQAKSLMKLDVTSPRAQAVIESHGLHGRRLAHTGAGRISGIQGKVYRLDRMRMITPIQNRRLLDSNDRLIGEGDVVTWKGRDWVVSRPNNPWDNGGHARVMVTPLGGGDAEAAVASQVTYKDEPKNLIFFRGTGGVTAPTTEDVRTVLNRRGIPIDDDLQAALNTDDPGVIAQALAKNPEVSNFLEQEAIDREDIQRRLELDNGNGDVPADHEPVEQDEYVSAQENKYDAQVLAAGRYGFFSDTAGKPRTIDDNIRKDLYSDYVGDELDVKMRGAYVDLDDTVQADISTDRSKVSVGTQLDEIAKLRLNNPGERQEALDQLHDLADTHPEYADQIQNLIDSIEEWADEFETNQQLRTQGPRSARPGEPTSVTPPAPTPPTTAPEGFTIPEEEPTPPVGPTPPETEVPGTPPSSAPPTPPEAPAEPGAEGGAPGGVPGGPAQPGASGGARRTPAPPATPEEKQSMAAKWNIGDDWQSFTNGDLDDDGEQLYEMRRRLSGLMQNARVRRVSQMFNTMRDDVDAKIADYNARNGRLSEPAVLERVDEKLQAAENFPRGMADGWERFARGDFDGDQQDMESFLDYTKDVRTANPELPPILDEMIADVQARYDALFGAEMFSDVIPPEGKRYYAGNNGFATAWRNFVAGKGDDPKKLQRLLSSIDKSISIKRGQAPGGDPNEESALGQMRKDVQDRLDSLTGAPSVPTEPNGPNAPTPTPTPTPTPEPEASPVSVPEPTPEPPAAPTSGVEPLSTQEDAMLKRWRGANTISRRDRATIDAAIAGQPVAGGAAQQLFGKLATEARALRVRANNPDALPGDARDADLAEGLVRKIGQAFRGATRPRPGGAPGPRRTPEPVEGTTPGAPSAPEAPEIPEAPETPEAPSAPGASEAPEAPAPSSTDYTGLTDDNLDAELNKLMADPNGFENPEMAAIAAEMDRRQAAWDRLNDPNLTYQERTQLQAQLEEEERGRYGGRGGIKTKTDRELRDEYERWLDTKFAAAENATNGVMLTPAGEKLFREGRLNTRDLFTRKRRTLAYASEELQRWFAENPRMSFAEFRAQAVDDDAAQAARRRAKNRGWESEFA